MTAQKNTTSQKLNEGQQEQNKVKRHTKWFAIPGLIIFGGFGLAAVLSMGFMEKALVRAEEIAETQPLGASKLPNFEQRQYLDDVLAGEQTGDRQNQWAGNNFHKLVLGQQQGVDNSNNPPFIQISELAVHQGMVNSVSFSPDGQMLATASTDGTARLWLQDGTLLQEFIGHQDWVNSVSFSPDGQQLATAAADGTVRLWSRDGTLLQEFIGHQGFVLSASFSPDGQMLATASDDRTARLWLQDGTLLQEFVGHQGIVWHVSFSPDGQHQQLATASQDGTARLWSLDGTLLQEFVGHQGTVMSVSFSPDGQQLATASLDGTVQLWRRAEMPDE
ncbi:MAG: WD40 repeat domain-containing protein [Cyanobacteria bacterium J06638_22]